MPTREDRRRATRRAVALLIAVVIISVGGTVFTLLSWSSLKTADAYIFPAAPVAAVVYASLGTVIVRRVPNRIGWILLGEGLGQAIVITLSAYAMFGVLHRGSLPRPELVGASAEWLFVPIVLGLAYMLLLFPTGDVPSPRWRWVARAMLAASVATVLALIVTPRAVSLPVPGGISVTFPNPIAVSAFAGTFIGTLPGIGAVSVLLFAAAADALVVRHRSGNAELRQQIKWVVFAAALFFVSQFALTITFVLAGQDSSMATAIGVVSATIALFGLPVAITIAILKYGLYEIDLIINRAVVYGLLATGLTAVYVAIVAGTGALLGRSGDPMLTVAAAVVIAVLFQPLRQRAQRAANRLVYGERATPYEVLARFADTMSETGSLEEQLDRMVALVASGTGATRVEVWIPVGTSLQVVATWPSGSPPPAPIDVGEGTPFEDATATFDIRRDDETLGTIVLSKPKNEPLSPAEAALVHNVASQAGLVVRNVRLAAELRLTIDELRASRRRLVEAQDSERRKIERNLHDGAQQRLVALGVQLSMLERIAKDADRRETLPDAISPLKAALQEALDELRDLARGIYPPLLADRGLVTALGAQAEKAVVRTRVDADGIGRYDQQTEAAVYFCALEALQNVSKYAEASAVSIRLAESDGWLTFDIEDDGRGFDVGSAHGSGIQGMADRLDAIGGSLEVESQRGSGTVVHGRVPVLATPRG
jgi:signal transduction histidine kinase